MTTTATDIDITTNTETATTPNTDTTPSSALVLHLESDDKKAGRAQVIQQAVEFAEAQGVSAEDSVKFIELLAGPHSTCPLRTRKLHICNLSAMAEERDIELDRLVGALQMGSGPAGQLLKLRAEGDQTLFLIAYERISPPSTTVGAKIETFWGIDLVVLETEGPLPLALGFDLNTNGEAYYLRFSKRLYLQNFKRADGSIGTKNRLDGIGGRTNLEDVAGAIAAAAGFPLQGARQFPQRESASSSARQGSFRGPQAPASSTPALTAEQLTADPFAG